MKAEEIFEKLLAMRQKIEHDTEEPMLDTDNALLYDVAKALGLSEAQAEILAGDAGQDANNYSQKPAEATYDFSHSGLGIGGLSRHDLSAEAAELMARGEMEIVEAFF